MSELSGKLLSEIKSKISKKEYYILLVVLIVVDFEMRTSLFWIILKASWANVFFSWLGLIFLLIIIVVNKALISKSEKVALQEHMNRKNDFEYNIATSEIELTIINNYFYYSANQRIILKNLTGKPISSLKGHLDFYKRDVRVESKEFLIKDLPEGKSHLVYNFKDLEVIEYWNYVIISYELVNKDDVLITNFGKGRQMFYMHDLDYLLNSKRDLRWYKKIIKHPFVVAKFYWTKNFWGKHTFSDVLKLFCRRIMISFLGLIFIVITAFIIVNISCFIWNFLTENLKYIMNMIK